MTHLKQFWQILFIFPIRITMINFQLKAIRRNILNVKISKLSDRRVTSEYIFTA